MNFVLELDERILETLQTELKAALEKHPQWPTDPVHAASSVVEEAGELQQAANESVYEPWKGSRDNLATEALHTMVTAYRFLMSLDRYEYFHSAQHAQALARCPRCNGEHLETTKHGKRYCEDCGWPGEPAPIDSD